MELRVWARRMLLLAPLMVLLSCAAPVDQARLGSIKRIGVASACAHDLHRVSIGYTVFANTYSRGDITDWGLDDEVVTMVAKHLKGRYSVGKAKFDAAFLRTRPRFLTSNPPSKGITPEPEFDAYLILLTSEFGEGVERMEATGLYTRSRPSFRGVGALAHANCIAVVYDGRAEQRLGFAGFKGFKSLGPELNLDRWSDYNEPQREQVRQALREALDSGIAQALVDLRLSSRPSP